MCSIIGYLGLTTAASEIVEGLKKMEYRGYDSAGIATCYDHNLLVRKGVGKVADVNQNVRLDTLSGNTGIGHTRWATHGSVCDTNAHPHPSNSGKIAIVHNGIIDNYLEIKSNLELRGYVFKSQTDSEVIVNLLQFYFDETHDIKKSMMKTVSKLKGHYAFVAMFDDGTLAAAKYHEPLIIGIGKTGYFLSSDVLGFVEKTDDAIYLDNAEFVILNNNNMLIYNFDGDLVKHNVTKVSKEFGDSSKGTFAHYTLKEISEQPVTILNVAKNAKSQLNSVAELIKHAKNLYITGSGTSYNTALVAKFLFSKHAKIKMDCLISSEVQFSPDLFEDKSILIAVSQSGESADVLDTVRLAKQANSKILSIVNVMTSSLVQQSSLSLGLNCGPEVGVAATKSFTSQLGIVYTLLNEITNGLIGLDLNEVSLAMSKIISHDSEVKNIARKLKYASDIYILGRGIHYPIAMEASLKLKEITYIHAEGLPGGELKHGPLALIDPNTFVIVFNPTDDTYIDTLSSVRQIKARGARVIGISDKPNDLYDYWIQLPKINESMYPLIEIVPVQLLSYYVAVEKDVDPDYPRNLAKSVTVK